MEMFYVNRNGTLRLANFTMRKVSVSKVCGKIPTGKTPNTVIFHAVLINKIFIKSQRSLQFIAVKRYQKVIPTKKEKGKR